MTHEDCMARAIELAKKAEGRTHPNPLVGAVIVKDGRIIGEGWHHRRGELHAEREALKHCTEPPIGGTMYVTLEPCCHTGRQPPCTEALIAAGIKTVYVGSADPNPLVAGGGIRALRANGIEVVTGFMKEQCDALNVPFFHYITTGRPWVLLKYAMTLDGKIAAYTGLSQWITGEEARENVHRDRNRYTAIMVGVGTVLKDDPHLTCRIPGGRDPIRIICDTNLNTPLTAQIVKAAPETPTWIVTACSDETRLAPYRAAGCEIVSCEKGADGHLDPQTLLNELGKREIDSLILEGGARLNGSFVRCGLVDRVQAYIAPKILGGTAAPSPVGGTGFPDPNRALRLGEVSITRLGEDLLLEADVLKEAEACLQA